MFDSIIYTVSTLGYLPQTQLLAKSVKRFMPKSKFIWILVEKRNEIIENEGNSGMSFGLVCLMVKAFCIRGHYFVNFVRENSLK
jgi:hypothetical protein